MSDKMEIFLMVVWILALVGASYYSVHLAFFMVGVTIADIYTRKRKYLKY